MGFTFSAKALLELGKELISSDEVAIYELIKNSVDAQRNLARDDIRITIKFQIMLKRSVYLKALSDLDSGVDSKVIIKNLAIGFEDTITEDKRSEILMELTEFDHNPEKMRIALMRIYQELNFISVSDAGHGMSLSELSSIFLRIGTNSRRKYNEQGEQFLGDKGVGRLSAMRLGEYLRVESTQKGESAWNILDIDWSLFSMADSVDASSINIVPRLGNNKKDSGFQGTLVTISNLNAEWDSDVVNSLVSGDIARMIDPFNPGLAKRTIKIIFNDKEILVPSIPQQLLQGAHATCTIDFGFEDQKAVLKGEINYALRQRQRGYRQEESEILSITQEVIKRRGKKGVAANKELSLSPESLRELGPFTAQIYWYNRRVLAEITDLTTKPSHSKEQVRQWAGGPMLYRYGFRILPYGSSGNDWLELDKNAFGQGGFKLNRQQVIGKVSITSPHQKLSEQTNREGLIKSNASEVLRRILMWVIHVEFRNLIKEADEEELLRRRFADQNSDRINISRENVIHTLKEIQSASSDSDLVLVKKLEIQVDQLSSEAAKVLQRLQEVEK